MDREKRRREKVGKKGWKGEGKRQIRMGQGKCTSSCQITHTCKTPRRHTQKSTMWTLPTTAFAESVNMCHCRDIYVQEGRHQLCQPLPLASAKDCI